MSVQSQIDRLNAIKTRIRTNLVAQGVTVPADTMLEEMANQILSVAGEDGSRGFSVLRITTSPSGYTTATGGFTPTYRVALSTVKSQSKAAEVLVGDTVIYSYYTYPVGYVDSSYVYLGARVSIRGSAGAAGTNGTTPVKGVDYWTEADQESIVQQVIVALGTPVFGRVDADKKITLSTEHLTEGTYKIGYDDKNGNWVEIGQLYAEDEPVIEPARYGIDYGQYKRIGGEDNRVYYDDLAGQTNYLAIYQENGDAPLHADSTITTKSSYHPLVVPDGKTKVKVTFPGIGSNKLFMSVASLSLSNEVYTRTANSGWLTEGVYEYDFGANVKYIGIYFRNSAYTHLGSYNTSGFTIEWL